jgi:hypothetical protein
MAQCGGFRHSVLCALLLFRILGLGGNILSGSNGSEPCTSDAKIIYALEGHAATIKVGDRVKLHGSKLKKTAGEQAFVVEKLNGDCGPFPRERWTSAANNGASVVAGGPLIASKGHGKILALMPTFRFALR